MTDPVLPPDPAVLELLRSERPAGPEVRARVRGRLLGAIAAVDAREPDGAGTRAAGPGSLGAKKAAALAFLAGGVAGGVLHAVWTKPPAERIVYVDRMLGPAPPVTGAVAGPASSSGPTSLPEAPPTIRAPASAGSSSRASQLAAERAILDEARKAIAEGDAARSLERLERHRRTFASPLLGEERDAMWIQALVKTGRYDEARSRGEVFRKRFPESLFSSAVESALESIP